MGNGALPNGPSYRAHPRLYPNRHGRPDRRCPVSGVERKWDFEGGRSVVDPSRTWTHGPYSTFGIGDFRFWSANATPARVSAIAKASRMPTGSLSMTAAATTPMIGTESVPMAAVAAGSRRNAANHAR